MNQLDQLLGSHPFTQGMSVPQVSLLAECGSYVEFSSGVYILRQGQPAKAFYLILSGAVEVELFSAAGGPVVLQKLCQGDVLGWSWLIRPYQWRFDGRVVERVGAVQIQVEPLRKFMEADSRFGYEIVTRFLNIIGDRLESERFRLVELYASHS